MKSMKIQLKFDKEENRHGKLTQEQIIYIHIYIRIIYINISYNANHHCRRVKKQFNLEIIIEKGDWMFLLMVYSITIQIRDKNQRELSQIIRLHLLIIYYIILNLIILNKLQYYAWQEWTNHSKCCPFIKFLLKKTIVFLLNHFSLSIKFYLFIKFPHLNSLLLLCLGLRILWDYFYCLRFSILS